MFIYKKDFIYIKNKKDFPDYPEMPYLFATHYVNCKTHARAEYRYICLRYFLIYYNMLESMENDRTVRGEYLLSKDSAWGFLIFCTFARFN